MARYIVRDSAGRVTSGEVPADGIHLGAGGAVSLNLDVAQITRYVRQGQTLRVVLANGEEIVIHGFFDATEGDGHSQLFISSSGQIYEVEISEAYGRFYEAQTEQLGAVGNGELVFNDVSQLTFADAPDALLEPVVAPAADGGAAFVAPAVMGGSFGAAGMIGAGAVGVALVSGGGGGNDGPAGPTISVNPIEGDNVVSAAEAFDGIVISGEVSGAEEGDRVTVELGGLTYHTTVTNGTWSVVVPGGSVDDGTGITATITLYNAGEEVVATTTAAFDVDTTAPTVTIDPVEGDDRVSANEEADGVPLSGTVTGVEDGAIVTVGIDGQTYTATATGGTWSLTVPADTLSDGALNVTADVSDAAGNPAVQAVRPISVDTGAPTIAIDPVEGDGRVSVAEGQDGIQVTGTTTSVEDGQTVTVRIGGVDYTGTVASGAWSVTVPTDALTPPAEQTEILVLASVADAAGNPASPASASFAIDQQPPTIQINTVEGDNIVNAAEDADGVVISGATTGAENGAPVTVTVDGVEYTTTVSAHAWSITIPAGTLPDNASVEVVAQVQDLSGNSSAAASQTIHIDTTASGVAIDPVEGDGLVGIDEEADGIRITGTTTNAFDGEAVAVTVAGVTYNTTVSDNTWSITIPAGTLADASDIAVSALVTDAAGNVSAAATTTFTLDTTAPEPPELSPDDLTAVNNTTFSGTDVANGLSFSGVAEPGSTVEVSLNGHTETVIADADGNWTVTFPAGVVSGEGTTELRIAVTDPSGNTTVLDPIPLTYDTVSTGSFATDQGVFAADEPTLNAEGLQNGTTLTGVADPGSTVRIQIGDEFVETVADENGNWSVDVSLEDFPSLADVEGDFDVELIVTDPLGNVSSSTVSVHIDTVLPEVNISDAPIGGDDGIINISESRSGNAVTVSGTAEPNSTITVEIEGGTVATGQADANGNWTVVLSGDNIPTLNNLTVNVTVTATDPSGNTTSTTGNVVVDTVAPPSANVVQDVTDAESDLAGIQLLNNGDIDARAFFTIDETGTLSRLGANGVAIGVTLTQYTFDNTLHDGSTLVINNIDEGGNSTAAIYLYDRDAGTATYDIDPDTFAGLNITKIDMTRADAPGVQQLTLTEAEFQDLLGQGDTMLIAGNPNDMVSAVGVAATGQTQTIDGQVYVEYDFGGATLLVDQDITLNGAVQV